MLRGRADQQYPEAFIAGLKSGLMEGIAKTVGLTLDRADRADRDVADQSTYHCCSAVLCRSPGTCRKTGVRI